MTVGEFPTEEQLEAALRELASEKKRIESEYARVYVLWYNLLVAEGKFK